MATGCGVIGWVTCDWLWCHRMGKATRSPAYAPLYFMINKYITHHSPFSILQSTSGLLHRIFATYSRVSVFAIKLYQDGKKIQIPELSFHKFLSLPTWKIPFTYHALPPTHSIQATTRHSLPITYYWASTHNAGTYAL